MARASVVCGYALAVVGALALACCSCTAPVKGGLLPSNATWSVPRTQSKSSPPVHVALLETDYVFDDAGNYVKRYHERYRILEAQGVESWGRAEIEWSPWYQARPVITAIVTDPDGKTHSLDPSSTVEGTKQSPEPLIYSDQKVLRSVLPAVRVGSIVDLRTEHRTTRPWFEGGMTREIPVASNVPIEAVRLTLDVPEGMPLRYQLLDARVGISDTRIGGRRRVVFTAGPSQALEPLEPLQPPEVSFWPSIVFSTGRDWASVARAFERTVRRQLDDAELKPAVLAILKGATSERDRMDRLLAWQRTQVRYADVEFGSASLVPGKPSETLKRGYGDCKDQATLLIALLRHAGIEARMALLRSGVGEDVHTELPGLGSFNHAIVYVPGNPPTWIDPTATHCRAGQLSVGTQGRRALVIDSGTTSLVITPAAPPQQNFYREARDVLLPDEGLGRIVETTTGGGLIEVALRGNYADVAASALQSHMDKYVKQQYLSKKPAKVETTRPDDLLVPFRVKVEAIESAVAETTDTDSVVYIDEREVFSTVPSALRYAEERKSALALPVPHRAEVRYHIVPPQGFVLRELPQPAPVDLAPGKLVREFKPGADGSIDAVIGFELLQPRLTAIEVNRFREAIKVFDEPQWIEVKFDHAGTRLINDGKVREGYQVFRRMLDASGNKGRDWRRYALALLTGGDVAAAREAARKACEVAPTVAANHRVYGYVLLHDGLGREFHAGFDRAGALAALKKAVELDPSDHLARVDYALVLEHDDQGSRYAIARDVEAAIAQYDKIPADDLSAISGQDYSPNPLIALMHLERFGELIERFRKKKGRDKSTAYLHVAALAITQGAARAFEESGRLKLEPQERIDALSAASGMSAQLRRYPESIELLAAAARLSRTPEEFHQRSAILSRFKRHDPSSMPDKTPEDIARKLLWVLMASDSLDDATRGQLFSSRAVRGQGLQRAKAFQDGLRSGLSNAATNADIVGARFMADSILVALVPSVESHAPIAELIRFNLVDAKPLDLEVVVVREGNAYRVAELGDTPLAICNGAVEALRKGDRDNARRWMEWARSLADAGRADATAIRLLSRVWRKDGTSDPKIAAACWCAPHPESPEEVVGWLTEASAKTKDPDVRLAIDQALALAHLQRSQPARAVEVTTRLNPTSSESADTRSLHCRGLLATGRFNECRSLIQGRLATHPSDGEAWYQVAEAEWRAGRIDAARAVLKKFVDAGSPNEHVLRMLAWLTLFRGNIAPGDVDYAVRAAQASHDKDGRVLQTLALMYAASGKDAEATQTLRRAADLWNGHDPDMQALVQGRVAQQHGLEATARSMYESIAKPKQDDPVSAYRLAQLWLSALGTPQPAQKP
ncbi:MAG: DUF3857 domain-containing protein [Deltaproteobacteria bacterium]|nr:DUF3857 domain-containing protein [Deltaproteobacteria bacterium]